MTQSKLTPLERSELRSEAHALKPTVMIGDSGLTQSVIKEIETALNAHGLIKVRVLGDDREARVTMYEDICEKCEAEPIQHIGKLLVLYRERPESSTKNTANATSKIKKTGKGLRKVTIVKPSASGTKKPTVSKVLVKGNERVTQGGTIKRAKVRQRSIKKAL